MKIGHCSTRRPTRRRRRRRTRIIALFVRETLTAIGNRTPLSGGTVRVENDYANPSAERMRTGLVYNNYNTHVRRAAHVGVEDLACS